MLFVGHRRASARRERFADETARILTFRRDVRHRRGQDAKYISTWPAMGASRAGPRLQRAHGSGGSWSLREARALQAARQAARDIRAFAANALCRARSGLGPEATGSDSRTSECETADNEGLSPKLGKHGTRVGRPVFLFRGRPSARAIIGPNGCRGHGGARTGRSREDGAAEAAMTAAVGATCGLGSRTSTH